MTPSDAHFTQDSLRSLVAGVLRDPPPTIAGTDNLVRIGLDSIGMMKVAAQLHGRGFEIGFEQLVEEPTLDAWWALYERCRPTR